MTAATITLKSDHGRYLAVEADGSVVANRPDAQAWEQIRVEPLGGDRVALRAWNDKYLTAELDGRVNARADQVNAWEEWRVDISNGRLTFRSSHKKYLTAEVDGQLRARAEQVGPWEQWEGDTSWLLDSAPPAVVVGGPTARPLVGPLRVERKLFRDDTGFRRVFFNSWFPALRILRDNPQEFERQVNAIAAAGYQGTRVFLAVGGWTDYWDGREVAPVSFKKWFFTGTHLRTDQLGVKIPAWPDYDDLLRTLLRAYRERKMRLHLSVGDMQAICPDPQKELDLNRRFARICAEEGGLDVVALAGDTNEYPMNRQGGNSPESIAQMGRVLKVWRDAIPGVLTAQGAALSEEPVELHASITHGEVCVTHTSRDPFSLCLKRTLGLVYWEGDYRGFPKPYWQGEPAGPGADSYQRLDDPASLTALYAMHALTGQASNQFSGPAVRSREPLESVWGFKELPRLLAAHLPEDIATWDHGSNRAGGIEYWWRGNQFVTSTMKDWDPSPPRPIAEWTLYSGDNTASGVGTPPRTTGLIVGRFR